MTGNLERLWFKWQFEAQSQIFVKRAGPVWLVVKSTRFPETTTFQTITKTAQSPCIFVWSFMLNFLTFFMTHTFATTVKSKWLAIKWRQDKTRECTMGGNPLKKKWALLSPRCLQCYLYRTRTSKKTQTAHFMKQLKGRLHSFDYDHNYSATFMTKCIDWRRQKVDLFLPDNG